MFYPAEILPENERLRPHKRAFCERLARNLEHFDHNPHVWGAGQYKPTPTILRLPAELRHAILVEVLDARELGMKRPNPITAPLAVVCKTFADDVKEVSKMWDHREAVAAGGTGFGREQMYSYIHDVNRDRAAAAAAIPAPATSRRKKKNAQRDAGWHKREKLAKQTGGRKRPSKSWNNKGQTWNGTRTKL